MRDCVLFVAMWVATSCGSSAPPPAETASSQEVSDEIETLRLELEMFCNPGITFEAVTEVGAHVEPKLRDGELKTTLVLLRDGSLSLVDLRLRVEKLMAKAGISTCPTLER
jgi:hypothetical protein